MAASDRILALDHASPAYRYAVELARVYTNIDRPILFLGPTGSGKTTLAREAHRLSQRPGAFVSVSSGELTKDLYADTLWGHVAGAYTGATGSRRGAYEEAAAGTLLLDDLAVMPMAVQAGILRCVESGRFRPLGANEDKKTRCRVFFASTVDPRELAARGDLLPDLQSRIGEFVVPVPALASRKEDILPLAHQIARRFLDEQGANGEVVFERPTQEALLRYRWPRNVRELKGVIERAIVHAGHSQDRILVRPVHLIERVRTAEEHPDRAARELSADVVHSVVERVDGNQSEAARVLGVHRNTIARYLRRAG